MKATKGFSVSILTPEDEPEVAALLEQFPLWSRRYARQTVARRKHIRSIKAKGKQ